MGFAYQLKGIRFGRPGADPDNLRVAVVREITEGDKALGHGDPGAVVLDMSDGLTMRLTIRTKRSHRKYFGFDVVINPPR